MSLTGDLVGWIDRRLTGPVSHTAPTDGLVCVPRWSTPLREVYGASDKVLTMALSQLLLGAPVPDGIGATSAAA